MTVTSIRPRDKRLLNSDGRLKLEWDAYFSRIESRLNEVVGGAGVTSVNVSGGSTGLTTSGGPVTSSGTITISGTLDLDNGGTGSTTASGARTNLGLGALAVEDDASGVPFTPAGSIAATDTQAAIEELDSEKAALSHAHAASDVISGTFADARIAESNVTQHETAIDHDALTNFVSDEHVAHSGVTLTAGAGLTGGGDISVNRSFAVGAGTGITVNADDVQISNGGVGTTQLADEGVTLAKLVHASAYTLLMRNAGSTGDPAYAKISSLTDSGGFGSGDKLIIEESTGELRKIDYDNLPGVGSSGPVAVVDSGALSSQPTLDIDLSGGADIYEIDLMSIAPATDGVLLYARFSQSSSFLSGASDYAWHRQDSGGSILDNFDSQIELGVGGNLGNATNESSFVTIRLFRPAASSFIKSIIWHGWGSKDSSDYAPIQGGGKLLANNNAIDGIQFLFSSGNIASGYYAVRSYSFT